MDFLQLVESEPVLRPAFLIVGEDPFGREMVLTTLREWIIGAGSADFNMTTLDARKVRSGRILDDARTPPFGAPARMVVVEHAEALDKPSADAIADYLAQPEEFSSIVLLASKIDMRQKLAKAVKASGEIVSIEQPKQTAAAGRAMQRWAVQRARAIGVRLETDAAALLQERVGNRFGAIASEIEKLSAYVGEAKRIAAEDVSALVSPSPAENIFALADAVAEKRPADALRLLEGLPREERVPERIIHMLAWHLRRVWRVKCSVEEGAPLQEAMAEFGVPPFLRQKMARQVKLLTRPRLVRCFHLLLEADQANKTTSLDPDLLVEMLCVRLCD